MLNIDMFKINVEYQYVQNRYLLSINFQKIDFELQILSNIVLSFFLKSTINIRFNVSTLNADFQYFFFMLENYPMTAIWKLLRWISGTLWYKYPNTCLKEWFWGKKWGDRMASLESVYACIL